MNKSAPCNCCVSSSNSICIHAVGTCDSNGPLIGATVTIKLSGTTVGTGTTDSAGNCCINITTVPATYNIQVSATNCTTNSSNHSCVAGTNNFTIVLSCYQLCVTTKDACSGATLTGSSVTITKGGTSYSGTTDSSGKFCTPPGIASGTWNWTASPPAGYSYLGSTSGSVSVSGCTSVSTSFPVVAGNVCVNGCHNCVGLTISSTLYLTDQYGTHTLTYDSGTNSWKCCFITTYTVYAKDCTSSSNNNCVSVSSGGAALFYELTCGSSYWQLVAGIQTCTTFPNNFLCRGSCTGDDPTCSGTLACTVSSQDVSGGCSPSLSLSFPSASWSGCFNVYTDNPSPGSGTVVVTS